jgi:hypothetical protein
VLDNHHGEGFLWGGAPVFGFLKSARYTPRERTPMSPSIAEANAALRNAVEQRREAQAEGRPHEEWYGDAEPMPEETSAEDVLRPATGCNVAMGYDERPGSLPFLELLEELRTLHLSKSQDYGSESDPLANIRQGAEFVGIEAWRGCMVRVADKVQRLKTYCRTGRLVHEGVRDTLLDLAAYSLLAIVLFDEGKDA